MINEYLDLICAENLKTTVENFIEKIESTTEMRRSAIIEGALSDDAKKVEQAIRCFKMIKINKND